MLVTVGCSQLKKGPSDQEILGILRRPEIAGMKTRNWQVGAKARCDEISEMNRARGIEDAWIVDYSFETESTFFATGWHDNDRTTMIVKKNGRWGEIDGAWGCPLQ